MNGGRRTSDSERLVQKPADFSLVLGGPLFRFWRGTRLAGGALEFLHRRIIVLALLAWAPLLLLSIVEGHAWGGSVALPFLYDVQLHLRLLVALPLLIVGELVVHRRLRSVVAQFLERSVIPDEARAPFDTACAAAQRLRDSIAMEILLIAFVYIVGVGFIWRTQGAVEVTSWYGVLTGGKWHPSLAGWWLGTVSLPLFQFVVLRWYFRIFIWARFLWQVSRIQLVLEPTDPDRCGGLGFLATGSQAFAPVLLAQGTQLAGTMANRILFAGAGLAEFKVEIFGIVAVMVFAILGPLFAFSPQLVAARREGLRQFGKLARRYTREFDDKWLRGGAPEGEPLIGSSDIQSLADLGNSFEVVRDMRWVPFTVRTILQLAVTTLLPIGPLLLTTISLEQLLARLLETIF